MAADEEDLLSLFDQYSNLVSKDIAIVINEASSKGISVKNPITVQQCTTTALFDMGANIFIISEKFFNLLPQKLKLIKSNTYTVR